MLFCTSLVALVGIADTPQSSPRKLQIVNTKRQSLICELLFPSSILTVKMNRKTLVIVLELEIYVYDISNMRLLHVIETTSNPDAICALSPTNPNQGAVLLFSTRPLTVANVIQAHKSPISFLSISRNGSLLATSSEKGTVIRVWSVPGAQKLYQFRRGTREAKIYSINFNLMGSLLAVSSAHASAVDGPGQEASGGNEEKSGGGVSTMLLRSTKSLSNSMGGYLPNSFTEMWEPSRDFAFLRVPTSGARCIVALSSTAPQVMVISSEGYFYLYGIDLERGGECVLLKQYNLLDTGEDEGE
ncbi:hypothetical protein MPER_06356 [Moniliophthora perniciosa FA553]|nr:hypothetical protein MPER_06356 [Moniliophthora perniciosa FA553]